MIPEEELADDYRRLQEEHRQLQEDYEQLNQMFENMGLGYEEALNLYDQAVESSRMKTDFIQQISHEIRTPLNILSGFAQILTSGMELDDAMKQEVTQGIADNTQRITGLVNKMLELADASSESAIERTDDAPAVMIAAQAVDESRITMSSHITFDLQIAPEVEMAMIHTNLQQATRALVLLLDNAMKFTHPAEAKGGATAITEKAKVVLSVAMLSQPTEQTEQPTEQAEHPEEGQTGQQLCMTVEDTGIGIPEEESEHIFDEFVQLDEYYDGTGIGLTVARSIARRLGGDIFLDTSYKEGARFVYTLPL
ncbi:MAG: HAMP domain-containing histidine kinase [Prevotella sp.]|nr:HAMP domain-containing histidine kinase [Prevotella sp.]